MARFFKSLPRAALMAGLAALGLMTGAHAQGGLNWSVGVSAPGAAISVSNAPMVVVPAPVMVPVAVVVPARAVYVAPAMVVQVPAYWVERQAYREPRRGHGWHRKHDHHAQGRHDDWPYQAASAPYATVRVQPAPHVWVR